MNVTPTGRVSPIVRDGKVVGARSQRSRPLWPWERAANRRFQEWLQERQSMIRASTLIAEWRHDA